MTGKNSPILGKYADCEIVKAKLSHAESLQHNLRESDKRECMIANCTPWRALMYPIKQKKAETYTVLLGDKPIMMFGVVPIEKFQVARIWMLCSQEVDERPKSFVKYSINIVEYFQSKYKLLENVVPIEHRKTILWLEYLGFHVYKKAFNLNQFKMYRFVRCQEENNSIIV
tara:strand:+ start:4080 stop:4592 length:513 start_codon:yes stop_codon:yes gene_type:complete